ncbi:MAG TPA: CHASE3 domain-containing protein, partial [Algoriphagus sp.]|nr:CHASE3 domain-containing protein [Algoriphagus sp.]
MTVQKKNLVIAFVAAISLVILLSIFSYSRIHAFIESAESLNHTTQVTLELEKIRGSLRDAETAKRGYLLTHDDLFLQAFTNSLQQYPSHIAIVKELTSENPEQQKSLVLVERLAHNRDDYFKKMLEVDKSRPVAPEEYLTGQAIMDSLVAEITRMEIRETILLEKHSNELLRQSLYAPLLLLALSIIALAVLVFSYLKLNKSLIQEHKIKAEGLMEAYELELAKEKERSENRFRDMVEQAPVAICLLRGKDFVVEIANDKQLQSWGTTREKLLNQPIFRDVPEDEIKWLVDKLNGVLETGEPYIETELPSKQSLDGIEKTKYLNFICEPFYEDQVIVGILAISTDVTEQVLDRKRVEESESKFKSLIDAAPIGIGVFRGRELIIENPNQEFIDIVGKGSSIVGKRLTEAMPELIEEGQPYLKILDDVFTSGKMYQSFGAPVSILKDGVMLAGFYDINYVPLFNAENQVYAILDIATDVTQRIIDTKKIQESEQRFQNLVRDASVGIVVLTGEEMKVEIVNQGYSRLFNLDPADLLNQNLFDILPDAEAYYRPILNGVMQSGLPVYLNDSPYSVVIKEKLIEGYLNVIYQPYRNISGDIIGVMAILTDVTQQVLAIKKGEESEQRFQAAIEAVQGILWTNNSIGEMEGEQIGWSSLTGQTYEEYRGFGWANALHPDDKKPTVGAWNLAVKNRSVFEFEHRLKTKDGNFRHFSIR